MKDFLAADRTVLILGLPLGSVPAAIHEIEACKGHLHDDKIDSLVADQSQNGPSKVVMQYKVQIGYEQVEDKMEEDSSDDDEHGPVGESIRVAHLRELVHDSSEGQSYEDQEDEDDIGENALEGLVDLPDVYDLHEEEEKSDQGHQDQQEIYHR